MGISPAENRHERFLLLQIDNSGFKVMQELSSQCRCCTSGIPRPIAAHLQQRTSPEIPRLWFCEDQLIYGMQHGMLMADFGKGEMR
jgi:hypothetical protein